MSVHEDLVVSYHQQDTDYYCGAACAQMVLSQIGSGLIDQDDLYASNHSHSTTELGWATAPDGLQFTMNDRAPAGNPTGLPHGHPYFVIDAETNEDTVSRKIVWTIHFWRVAPIALVYHSQHWIVVRGYTASAAPNNAADNAIVLSGFDVNNPWPPTPSWSDPAAAAPPPHGDTDGCGTGGVRGVADEHISYTTWRDTYMTGVDFGHWNGKFIAVCDPEPPPSSPGVRGFIEERLARDKFLSAEDATGRAIAGLQVYGLKERTQIAKILRQAQPEAPVIVQRLDAPGKFYYIVPVRENTRTTPLAICVDAFTGVYRQSAIRAGSEGSVFTAIERDAALRMVADKSFELPDQTGRIKVRPDALCHYPHLVWKPCRESLSPYYPFHMFTAGSQHIYVRTDGMVFTTLHDTDRGI